MTDSFSLWHCLQSAPLEGAFQERPRFIRPHHGGARGALTGARRLLGDLSFAAKHARNEAAKVMQRCWKNKKTSAGRGPIDMLRSLFMDSRTPQAAADSPFYKPAALAIRNSLKTDPDVQKALTEAWDACSTACGSREGLNFDSYAVMCRKLYLAGKLDEGDADIDPKDCLENIKEDWKDDAGGAQLLNEDLFRKCWFQLADLNCDSVSSDDYCDWLENAIDTVTYVDEFGLRVWKSDEELLERVRVAAKVSKKDKGWAKAQAMWKVAFPANAFAKFKPEEPPPPKPEVLKKPEVKKPPPKISAGRLDAITARFGEPPAAADDITAWDPPPKPAPAPAVEEPPPRIRRRRHACPHHRRRRLRLLNSNRSSPRSSLQRPSMWLSAAGRLNPTSRRRVRRRPSPAKSASFRRTWTRM